MSNHIFNQDSTEAHSAASILNGDPDGIINYERTNHKWAKSLYDIAETYTWFVGEVDISRDKLNNNKLSDQHKRMYDLILAQLITNDSIQTKQLDSINGYITSPVVNALLARQAYEESNHSKAYSVMAEDICGDTDRIFSMHKHDSELYRKNQAIADMYAKLYREDNPTTFDLLKVFCANQILEELVFPGGFVSMFSIGHIMTGSAKMIQFIMRDETNHVLIFKNIFRTTCRENGINITDSHHSDFVDELHDMIRIMCDAEIRWTKYATKGVLGFSDESIMIYVQHKANSVCKNLGLPLTFDDTDGGPLEKLRLKYDLLASDNKSNFFETKVADYDMSGLDMSDL